MNLFNLIFKMRKDLLFFLSSILLAFFLLFLFLLLINQISKTQDKNNINENKIHLNYLTYKTQRIEENIFKIQKKHKVDRIKENFNIIFFDIQNNFDFSSIDCDHLYFMESQRKYYEIPKYIYYRLIYKESAFLMFKDNGDVTKSNKGAIGYMQLLKETFNDIANNYNLENIDNINDPYHNIIAGTFYLRKRKNDMNRLFPNTTENYKWILALSAYNAGIGNVRKANGVPNFLETINYVDFIMRDYDINNKKLLTNYEN